MPLTVFWDVLSITTLLRPFSEVCIPSKCLNTIEKEHLHRHTVKHTYPSHCHRKTFSTGHTILYLVVFCPLPVESLGVFDLHRRYKKKHFLKNPCLIPTNVVYFHCTHYPVQYKSINSDMILRACICSDRKIFQVSKLWTDLRTHRQQCRPCTPQV